MTTRNYCAACGRDVNKFQLADPSHSAREQ